MPTKRYHYIIITLVFTILLISTAKAITINVTVTPTAILPGESVKITVTSDSAGEGLITVKPPDGGGSATSIPISFSTAGIKYKYYPGDWLDAGQEASTATLGEYKVHVVLHNGEEARSADSFRVSWEVIPISPIGSIGLLLTLFAAFGTYALTKRKTLVKV